MFGNLEKDKKNFEKEKENFKKYEKFEADVEKIKNKNNLPLKRPPAYYNDSSTLVSLALSFPFIVILTMGFWSATDLKYIGAVLSMVTLLVAFGFSIAGIAEGKRITSAILALLLNLALLAFVPYIIYAT